MPEAGVPLSPEDDNLTTPEILLLSELFVSQGVNKIRLTGGEPTIRKDILPLMQRLGDLRSKGLKELALTTNGVALWRKLDAMVQAGLTGVNLSLDTLDPHLFQIITRRKGFEAVTKSMDRIQELNKLGAGLKLKINCVVTRGVNDREILDFVELGREKDIEVRFIEYMPFDGNKWEKTKMFSYEEMLQVIRTKYPDVHRLHDKKGETSKTWQVPGFVGKMGFITSMTENFCGTCNRLRITSDGNLKVCLFGNSEVSLRDLLRESTDGSPLDEEAYAAMREFESSNRSSADGATTILKDYVHERQLLEVIGKAVGRKKARHAGMENLSTMPNRPMILIDDLRHSFSNGLQHVSGMLSNGVHRCYSNANGVQTWRHASQNTSPRAQQRSISFTVRKHPARQERQAEARIAGHNEKDATNSHVHTANAYRIQYAAEPQKDGAAAAQMPSQLPHLTAESNVHMVSIGEKSATFREALAIATVTFSNPSVLPAIRLHSLKKGDVLSVARIAAIMGAKRTPDIIPLCHPGLQITNIEVDVEAVDSYGTKESDTNQDFSSEMRPETTDAKLFASKQKWMRKGVGRFGGVKIVAKVACAGKTGVEMEALTAASAGALTVVDMCKALDKDMVIGGLKMVYKAGGRSGTFMDDLWMSP